MLIATKQTLVKAKDGRTASKVSFTLAKRYSLGFIEQGGEVLAVEPFDCIYSPEIWAQELDAPALSDYDAPEQKMRIKDYVESPRKIALHLTNGQVVTGDGYEFTVTPLAKTYPTDIIEGTLMVGGDGSRSIGAAAVC